MPRSGIPPHVRCDPRSFADHKIKVYYINATKIAQEIGLGNRTNTILQSAFFRITAVIPVEKAVEEMKHFIVKSYGKKGEDVVNKNYAAVDRGGEYQELAIDPAWSKLPADPAKDYGDEPEFITKVVRPINGQDGDLLPVSSFKGIEDGTWPAGTAKFEKRGVSAFVPVSFRFGPLTTVSSVTSVRMFVLTLVSVRSSSTRKSSQASTALLPAR